MKALVKKQYLLPFILITSLFFSVGSSPCHFGCAQQAFSGRDAHFAHPIVAGSVLFYLGYFVMAIPAGLLIDRRGYRTGVVIGLLLYGIGALLFWPGAQIMSFGFFLFSLFIIACGLVFLETAANPYVTELGDHDTAPRVLTWRSRLMGLAASLVRWPAACSFFRAMARTALPCHTW